MVGRAVCVVVARARADAGWAVPVAARVVWGWWVAERVQGMGMGVVVGSEAMALMMEAGVVLWG